jgi:hypothetical protein
MCETCVQKSTITTQQLWIYKYTTILTTCFTLTYFTAIFINFKSMFTIHITRNIRTACNRTSIETNPNKYECFLFLRKVALFSLWLNLKKQRHAPCALIDFISFTFFPTSTLLHKTNIAPQYRLKIKNPIGKIRCLGWVFIPCFRVVTFVMLSWWCPAFIVYQTWWGSVRKEYGIYRIQVKYSNTHWHCIFIS